MKYRTLLPDALRLHFEEHLPRLEVGRRLDIPKSTVCDFFARFAKYEISWPLPADMRPEKPVVRKRPRRPNFPREFNIALAEKASVPSAKVALLAREHGINDNLLFNWRQRYRHLLPDEIQRPIREQDSVIPVVLPDMVLSQLRKHLQQIGVIIGFH